MTVVAPSARIRLVIAVFLMMVGLPATVWVKSTSSLLMMIISLSCPWSLTCGVTSSRRVASLKSILMLPVLSTVWNGTVLPLSITAIWLSRVVIEGAERMFNLLAASRAESWTSSR